ncbi:MAG: AI-2E family transporter [Pseudomonadota bacterium]|nr:AI-2E family transporter [Pseudomonadota bacterium]
MRIAFLFLLAISISLLFYQVVERFLIALLMAAVLAGLAHPVYRWFVDRLRGHENTASAATVLLCLMLVIVPVTLFLGVVVNEAVEVSKTASEWVERHVQQPEELQEKIRAIPALQRLLPYQDQILEKVGELAGKVGGFVAHGMAAGARVTAGYFLSLFVMLYAMFYFLVEGRAILDAVLRFTPLTDGDKTDLLGTFVSVSRATVKGTLVIGIVQGGLAGLSFAVVGIEGAVFWGAVMAVLSIVPGIGTALVWVPAVIFLALGGQTGAAVGVALWCAIVVGTADNVLRPSLVGRDTAMPDILVLLTTLGGLFLFGASGIVLGPVVGALFVAVWGLWGAAVEAGQTTESAEGVQDGD